MSTQSTAHDIPRPWRDHGAQPLTAAASDGNTPGVTTTTEATVQEPTQEPIQEPIQDTVAEDQAASSAVAEPDAVTTALMAPTEPREVNVSQQFASGRTSSRDPRSYLLSPSSLLTRRAEDFRRLRAHLKYRLGERGTVLIASPRHGEGRSVTALNLGLAFAQEYERVVYVEADFRRPALHTFFELEQKGGLSRLLQRQTPIGEDVGEELLPTDVPGFYLLPAGVRSGPPELFESPRMAEVLARLKIEADWVIVDGPPLLTYVESQMLAQLVDGVAIVALEGRTRYDDVTRVSTQLDSIMANVICAVYVRRK
jgi:protein-tyrosine kinase